MTQTLVRPRSDADPDLVPASTAELTPAPRPRRSWRTVLAAITDARAAAAGPLPPTMLVGPNGSVQWHRLPR